MNEYDLIVEKYIKNNIKDFKLKNADEVKVILGFDFRTCAGFKNLSEEHKEKAEYLICNFINMSGLETREKREIIDVEYCVEYEVEFFKVYVKTETRTSYSRLLLDGSVA